MNSKNGKAATSKITTAADRNAAVMSLFHGSCNCNITPGNFSNVNNCATANTMNNDARTRLMTCVFLVFGRGAWVIFANMLMLVVYALFSASKSVVIFVNMLALFYLARYCT